MPRPRRKADEQGRLCCTACNQWQLPAAFSPAPTTSGRASRCKRCKAAAIRRQRQLLRLKQRRNLITSAAASSRLNY